MSKEQVLYPQDFSTQKESPLAPEQISKMWYLVKAARSARAYPDQSGYFVKTAGMTRGGFVYTGGNKEYGMSDAFVHGETSVVSALKDLTDDKIEMIAWFKDGELSPNDFGRPCGNCRDVLLKYCDPDLILLNGNEFNFTYTKLKDFLFDDYKYLNLDHVRTPDIKAALDAMRGGTNVYLPDAMKGKMYGAALVSKDGTIWQGRHYANVGYKSVTPVLSSVISWQNSYPLGEVSKTHLKLQRLVVVSEEGIPDVFYGDRQAILENDEIRRRYTGEGPLRIQLVHAVRRPSGNIIIKEAKWTTSEEWLPHPFSPGAFRMDDVMDGQLAKLLGK